MKGSGFEDIVYQSGLCTSGSLQGVLSGSHYNRAWIIHQTVAEALERLLLKRFKYERNHEVPDDFCHLVCNPTEQNVKQLKDETKQIYETYKNYRENIRNGGIGKTPQFWMFYMDLIRIQTLAHTAVQSNDLEMLIFSWQSFLPLYFATNKVNYAR